MYHLYFRHVLDTPATETHFMEQLHELDHKLNFAKLQQFKDTAAIGDVKDVLERLKFKVCCSCFAIGEECINISACLLGCHKSERLFNGICCSI